MIHNAHINLPPSWGIHIFINPTWFFTANLSTWHPGLQRLLQTNKQNRGGEEDGNSSSSSSFPSSSFRGIWHGRPIFVSWIPDSFTQQLRTAKPKQVLHATWFWKQIIVDRVLLFSGNGVFCGNHMVVSSSFSTAETTQTVVDSSFSSQTTTTTSTTPTTIWQLLGWSSPDSYDNHHHNLDYLGTPWRQLQGIGGDGSTHSYRNRTSMIRLLDYAASNKQAQQDWNHGGMAEHVWVLRTMQRYNNQHHDDASVTPDNAVQTTLFRIASVEQTEMFGGVLHLTTNNATGSGSSTTLRHVPYVASGTFANLVWHERDTLLQHCPELKTIFPSLHEPTCFGAHPQPDTCRQSICALQEVIPSSGC
jgi:hypothetical protein